MRVKVNSERCQGHGLCYSLAPALFADDDQGYSVVTHPGEITGDLVDDAREGVRSCPERAISIED